jgi:hypothetical protein
MTDYHIEPYPGPTYEEEWATLLGRLHQVTAGQWFRTVDVIEKIDFIAQAPAEIEYARRMKDDQGFAKSLGRYLTGKAGRTFGELVITSRATGGKHGRLYKIEKV